MLIIVHRSAPPQCYTFPPGAGSQFRRWALSNVNSQGIAGDNGHDDRPCKSSGRPLFSADAPFRIVGMRYFLATLLVLLTPVIVDADEASLHVATFQVDVTPPLGAALCNGNVTPAMEIVSPLTARGVVLLGAGDPIVLCAVDWVGIGNEGYERFRQTIADAVRTPRHRVALHTLHQHDAPGSDFATERLLTEYGLAGQFSSPDFDFEVMTRLGNAAAAAVAEETSSSQDADKWTVRSAERVTHIGLGTGVVEKVASNRRILGDDGRVVLQRQSAGGRRPEARAAPEGTIDPMVRVISFWNDDKPLAVLTYYATHPQSYYGKGGVNWDFVGMARATREASLPNVPHLHFNGAGGNVAAGKYNDGAKQNRPVLASRLAAGMQRAWENQAKHPVSADDVSWFSEDVALPVRDTLVEEELTAVLEDESARRKSRLRAGRDLVFLRRMQAGHRISLSCLHLGKTRVLHMPGELFVEYQLAAQQMLPDAFVAMAAYGDYGPGYIGTEIAYGQGGYETGVVSRVAPQVEGVLTGAMRRLLHGQPITAKEQAAAGPPRPPNILLITCDNLGYGDLPTYNSSATIRSPALDKLASEGALLTSFYTASPTCTVSRACLLTGRIAQRHGLVNQLPGVEGNYGVGLSHEERLIPQYLKRAPVPYATGCFGKWNIGFAEGSRPPERGFDEFIGHASGNMDYYYHNYRDKHDLYEGLQELHREGEYATDIFAEAAIDFISRHSQRGVPWFCYLPFNAPHFPNAGNKRPGQPSIWQVPDDALEAIGLNAGEMDPRKRYEAVVFALDEAIGNVLQAVDDLAQRENTFVFFMSDNGAFRLDREGLDVGINDPLRSGGVTCWEGGLRVPAMVRWPNQIHPGTVIDEVCWSPDLLIACAMLANATLPQDVVLDGKDPLPLLTEGAASSHESLFFEFRRHAALRQGDWKIVRERPNHPWQLFDLSSDIGESQNLADSQPERLQRLVTSFQRWQESAE